MRTVLVVLLSGCATINTAGMSESCKRLYDACLNTCPGAARGGPPPTSNLQIEVAACTNDCNERAKKCQ